MKSKVVAVIVVIFVIVIAGVVLDLVSAKLSTSNITTTSIATAGSNSQVQIISDNLTLGYLSGLWEIELKNSGNISVSTINIVLNTPIESRVCSGSTPSDGLVFSLCPPLAANPLPPGATIVGAASGVGEGSAKIGSSYPVSARITFANGNSTWLNTTVTAQTAP